MHGKFNLSAADRAENKALDLAKNLSEVWRFKTPNAALAVAINTPQSLVPLNCRLNLQKLQGKDEVQRATAKRCDKRLALELRPSSLILSDALAARHGSYYYGDD
jgi:hypothetical protein